MAEIQLKERSKTIPWKPLLLIVLVSALLITIWSLWPAKTEEIIEEESVKPVRVIEVAEESGPVEMEYLGTVQAKEFKQMSFKIPGKLEAISLVEGQSVKKGQVLAQLETNDFELAVSAAKNTMDVAQSTYSFAQDNYDKMSELKESGAISTQDLDRARLEMEDWRARFNNAEIDYRSKLNMLDDSILKADMDGIVVEVLYKVGENILPAYPVVVLRDKELELTMGISQNDLNLVKVGTPAKINVAGDIYTGKVKSIGQIPDGQTKTYKTTVALSDTSLSLGMTAKITLELGNEKAIYIPINSIVNDGEDFVYVLDQNSVVHKKIIQIGRINNTKVQVTGLEKGDRIISEGIKNLQAGDKVSVQK